jgi:hypothetical protein
LATVGDNNDGDSDVVSVESDATESDEDLGADAGDGLACI